MQSSVNRRVDDATIGEVVVSFDSIFGCGQLYCTFDDGTADEVVHYSHGKQLSELCKESYEPLWINGGGHCNLELYPEYIKHMKKFVSTIGKSRAPTNKSDKANVDPDPKSKPSENGSSGDSEITSDCPEVSRNRLDSRLDKTNKSNKLETLFRFYMTFGNDAYSLMNLGLVASLLEIDYHLQDWNNIRQFTPHDDFHAQEAVDERFVSRYNYLNDLPSLDPELYRHLIFLKSRGSCFHYLLRTPFYVKKRICATGKTTE
ncbi:hypothetical protein Syun_001852 [Stephania yunnanensis]|uniref:Uncharacterized protein n=1 Tax=Stephania yunnanensis TaxID=152371 RepID=A0AAP0LGI2_9MAGN